MPIVNENGMEIIYNLNVPDDEQIIIYEMKKYMARANEYRKYALEHTWTHERASARINPLNI